MTLLENGTDGTDRWDRQDLSVWRWVGQTAPLYIRGCPSVRPNDMYLFSCSKLSVPFHPRSPCVNTRRHEENYQTYIVPPGHDKPYRSTGFILFPLRYRPHAR
jgi:hypothetical protein